MLEDLNRALDLRPGLVPALRQRASLLAHAKKFTAAVSDLELARKLEPTIRPRLCNWPPFSWSRASPTTHYGSTRKSFRPIRRTGWPIAAAVTCISRRANIAKRSQISKRPARLNADDSGVLNNLAWVLATSPEESLRDGKRAIELAKRACDVTEYKQPHILSTLAAGYAEMGDFATAVEWSKKALELGDETQKAELAKELESYQSSKPWRELQTAAADQSNPTEGTRR